MDSLPSLIFNKIIGYYQGSIKEIFNIAKLLGHEKTIDPSYTDYMNKIGKMINIYKCSHDFEIQNPQHLNIPNLPNLPIISNRADYLNFHGISDNQLSEIKSLTDNINVLVSQQFSTFEWGNGLDLIEGIWIDYGGDYFSYPCRINLYLSDSDIPKYKHRDIPLLFHSRINKQSSEFQLFSETTPFIMKPRYHPFIRIKIINGSGQTINNIRIRIDYRSILNNDHNIYQLTRHLHTLHHQSLKLKSTTEMNDYHYNTLDLSFEFWQKWKNNAGYYGCMIYSPVPLISKIIISLGESIDALSFDSSFIHKLAGLYNLPQLPNRFCYPIIFSDNSYHNKCKNKSDFGAEIFKKIKVSGTFSHLPISPILVYETVLNFDTNE